MIESHYTTDIKLKRPQINVAEPPEAIPKNKSFSDKEASARIGQINLDIYENTKKEKSKHGFNKSLYFKIFGGITLLTAGIACFCKIRNLFKKP